MQPRLRQVHYAHIMEKANNLAWRLSYEQHEPHKECNCHACYGDRDRSCQDPHKCMKAAKMKMDSILPKWDLRNASGNEDELAPNILPPDNGGVITCTDRPTIKDLAEGFRIFTRPHLAKPEADDPLQLPELEDAHTIRFSISSEVINAGSAEASAKLGIVSGDSELAFIVPNELPQTEDVSELIATILCLRMAPPTAQVDIELRDGSALKSFCLKATGWEDLGWINSPSGYIYRPSTPTKGTCAKLSEMTQSLLYKHIRARKTAKDRKQTVENLKLIQSSYKANFGTLPTNGSIWSSIRTKYLSQKARNFFWKSIHGAHRIGKYWKNIPTMEDRAKCSHCGDTESLQHILIECERPGRKEIWRLAKTLWEKKSLPWHEPSLGGVLGAGLAVFRDANGKELKGSS
ncbi:hypothetical protein C8F01DRAFT_1084395 [Mycena amicta]|nr:hypothetical protein C8F01DRAFT_1084393 [Mycena amicta]KAJ7059969.1 hypothetical protein C8F01DRAFT_1084395 [Mycena amicta]